MIVGVNNKKAGSIPRSLPLVERRQLIKVAYDGVNKYRLIDFSELNYEIPFMTLRLV